MTFAQLNNSNLKKSVMEKFKVLPSTLTCLLEKYFIVGSVQKLGGENIMCVLHNQVNIDTA